MSIKILNEGFELLHKNSLCEEKSNSSDLEKALESALNHLAMRQEMNIKKYEIAFQDAIESQYPDKSWWEVTDCDIFWDLAENRNPSLTIKHIIDKLKPEFKESLEEGIEDKFFTKAKADAKKLKSLYKKVKDVDKAFKSLGYSYNGDSYEKKVSDGIFVVFSETSSGRFDYNVVNEKERTGTASDVVVLFKEEDESFRNKPLKNRKLKEAVALKESFPTHGNKIDLEKVIQALWEKGNEIGGEDWIEVFNPNEVSKLSSGEEYCNRIEVTGADDKQIKISLKTNGGNIEYQIFNEGRDWKKASSIDELWKVIFDRVGRKTNESLRRKPMRESEKEPTIKRYSDVRPYSERKYWYFTTHGVQPGSIPKDLHVLEVRDGENERGTQGTFVMLDGVLNTSELRKYDMRELAPKEETEKRRIRPQGERITAWESLKNKKKKSSLKEDYITDLVAEILSGKVKKPSHKVFKWKSNNGDSGEVTYRGVDYAFRKLPNGDYKVMRSSDAGWNWSETLFKESKLRENKNLKEAEAPAGYSPKKQRTLKEAKWSNKWPRYNFEFEDGWKISAVNEEEAVEKYDDIQKNIHKGASRSSKELDALAQHLYDSNDEWSFNYFSDDELSILWSMCGVLSSKAYDDEVYDAITSRPNAEEIFDKAKDMAVSSVKTNESFYKKQESFKRTKVLKENKKKLTESFDDMEVFMNTWANYNENGADSGITPTGWMSIDDAIEYCEEYADYEPFINDTDNVPFDDINEYSNASSVLQELKELQESDVDEDVVAAIVEATGYGIKEAVEIAERGDYYWYPGISSYTDLAYAVIDEIGSLKDALGDRVVNYIDEDQMRREYRWDIREIMRDTAEQEVDEAHAGEVDISNVPTSKEFSIDEWFDEDDEYTEDDLREQISDDLEYEYDSAPVSFDIEVSNDGKKVTAKNIEWDGYDREQEIEDWMDEHEDEWLDMIIGEEIEAAERGEADLSNYFDYEAFGRDLSFDGYTITDKGIILVN